MRPYFLFRIRNPCFLIFFERVSDTLNLLECEPCILICLNIECMCHRKKEKIILGSLYRHSPLCQIEEQERLCESILFLYDCLFIDMLPEDHFEICLVWHSFLCSYFLEPKKIKTWDGEGDTIILIAYKSYWIKPIGLECQRSFLPLTNHIHAPILFIHSFESIGGV